MTATAENKPGTAQYGALASLALAMLLASLGISSANVALLALSLDFAASFAHVQWVVLAYLLAITVGVVSAGRLGDLLGHRRVLLGGLMLFTLASVLCTVAPTLSLLIAARLLQGLGASVLIALTVAAMRETAPPERLGSAMGLLGTMSAIGTALGPSLGGVLLAGPGWRAIFAVMAVSGLAALLLGWRCLPRSETAETSTGVRFDIPGTLLLAAVLAAYALGMTLGKAAFGPLNLALLLAAMLGLLVFLQVEARAAAPLIHPEALRERALSLSLAMNGLVCTVISTTLIVAPFYLASVMGLGPVMIGGVMAVGPVISTLTGVPAGRLVDRVGASRMIGAGLGLMAAGAFGLVLLPVLFGLVGYIVAIAIITPGYQLFLAANNTAVMTQAAADQRGVRSGLLNLSRNLGFITGAAVMGALFAYATGTHDLANASREAVTSGQQVTFLVAGGLMLLALATSSLLNRSRAATITAE
jgi:MFS family permease